MVKSDTNLSRFSLFLIFRSEGLPTKRQKLSDETVSTTTGAHGTSRMSDTSQIQRRYGATHPLPDIFYNCVIKLSNLSPEEEREIRRHIIAFNGYVYYVPL